VLALGLPRVPPRAASQAGRGWRARLGLDALDFFRRGDPLVFLFTTFLMAVPMAAFYPYAPQHLKAMGSEAPTAMMTIGQITESVCMLLLGWMLARWRVKWVMSVGIGCAVLRYLVMAFAWPADSPGMMSFGIALHGVIFALYFVTAQVFLELRVDPAVRIRAQALLATAGSGLGSLTGIALAGGWHSLVWRMPMSEPARWAAFWSGLSLVALAALIFFLRFYRGRTRET